MSSSILKIECLSCQATYGQLVELHRTLASTITSQRCRKCNSQDIVVGIPLQDVKLWEMQHGQS